MSILKFLAYRKSSRPIPPVLLILSAALVLSAGAAEPPAWPPALKSGIDALVQPVLAADYAVGYAIGVIQNTNLFTSGYGRIARHSNRMPDRRTLFQIGSISKTFVGVQLAELVRRKQVKLDDPIDLYLPESMPGPAWGDRKITLLDLATHRSGLPGLPADYLRWAGQDYTTTRLLQWLAAYRLDRAPGDRYEYSNVGPAILGFILSRIEGQSWEDYCRDTICAPLGMADTRLTLTPEQRGRLAQGHRPDLDPVPLEDIGVMAPSGGLISSVDDMAIYLRAHMGLIDTPLQAAMTTAMAKYNTTGPATGAGVSLDNGLCWFRVKTPTEEVVFYAGTTLGFFSVVIFNPEKKAGVIVLGNQESQINQDLAFGIWRLLNGQSCPPLKLRQTVARAPAALAPFCGTYLVARVEDQIHESRDQVARVALYGEGLKLSLPGQERARLFPESENAFFLKGVSDAAATVKFTRAADGGVKSMTLIYNGTERTLEKIK